MISSHDDIIWWYHMMILCAAASSVVVWECFILLRIIRFGGKGGGGGIIKWDSPRNVRRHGGNHNVTFAQQCLRGLLCGMHKPQDAKQPPRTLRGGSHVMMPSVKRWKIDLYTHTRLTKVSLHATMHHRCGGGGGSWGILDLVGGRLSSAPSSHAT